MNQQQFKELKESLLEQGYKIYNQRWKLEDYCMGKDFHKEDNKWEEDRCAYQILLYIYDWSDITREYYERVPQNIKEKVSIEITFNVSRTIDERIEMTMSWHDDTTIEEVEAQAEEFYKWVNFVWFEPREEKTKEN